MTNKERLNAMSDSELANWLCNVGYKCYDTVYVDDIDDLCYYDGDVDEYVLPDVKGGEDTHFYGGANQFDILDWLQEEIG